MGSRWFRGVSVLPDGRGLIVGARGLMLATQGGTFTASKAQF